MLFEEGHHQQDAAIAILDVRRMDDGQKQKTFGIYKKMPLLALDLLARIIAWRVNRGPPFSALFTLWLSMMAAVGLDARSASSRQRT